MSQRPRRRANATRQTANQSDSTWMPLGRECPWCGSRDTEFVKRGLAGGQASPDQYIRCHDCDRVTYDIVARSDRDIRINSYRQGGVFRDPEFQTRYTIYRMLKVGFNEFLLYLRPITPEDSTSQDHYR
ncbi:MAG: hypothetical protein M9953_04700 [Thermomicrobiales bacterium]|nr:hypothetical protein [Thermomicrobiales bacterium]MCO5224616.1 hypothetical protein [Thermomicrobiales bacterium]MCO5227381.1 hypothetical protein [Thermomicrobiales bacterium]